MILSMSSDLHTKQTVWTVRAADDTREIHHQTGINSVGYAGFFASMYRSEALDKIPTFE